MNGKSPTRKMALQPWFNSQRHKAAPRASGSAWSTKSPGVVAANDETGGRNRGISSQLSRFVEQDAPGPDQASPGWARAWKLAAKPGVFDVFNCVTVPIPRNRDRIKAVLQRGFTKACDPCACHVLDLAALLPGHRFERMAITAPRTRFHFDKSDRAVEAGDNIDFLAVDAIATRQDAPASS